MLWKELEDVQMTVLSNLKRTLRRLEQYIYVATGLEYKSLGHITQKPSTTAKQGEQPAPESCRAQSGLQRCCVLTSYLDGSHGLRAALNVPTEVSVLEGAAVPSP